MKRKNRIRSCTFIAATLCVAIPFAAYAQCSGEGISSYVQSGATPDQAFHAPATLSRAQFLELLADASQRPVQLWTTSCTIGELSH